MCSFGQVASINFVSAEDVSADQVGGCPTTGMVAQRSANIVESDRMRQLNVVPRDDLVPGEGGRRAVDPVFAGQLSDEMT